MTRRLQIPHYLPTLSFGGCEDLAMRLAVRTGGLLYCPRMRSEPAKMITDAAKFHGIYKARRIAEDRVYFEDSPKSRE